MTPRSWKFAAIAASSGAIAAAALGGVALADEHDAPQAPPAISVEAPLTDADKALVTSPDDRRDATIAGDTVDSPATPVSPATAADPAAVDSPASPVTADSPVSPVTAQSPATPAEAETPASPASPVTPPSPASPVTPDSPASPVTPVTP